MKVRPGPELAGLAYMKRCGHPVRQVFQQRTRGIVVHHHAEALALGGVQGKRGWLQHQCEIRQGGRVIGQQAQPLLVLEPGCQAVAAGQHQVDVDAAGGLLRAQLGRQLRSRRLAERKARQQARVCGAERLERRLHELEGATDVKDGQADGGSDRRAGDGSGGGGSEGGPACEHWYFPFDGETIHPGGGGGSGLVRGARAAR